VFNFDGCARNSIKNWVGTTEKWGAPKNFFGAARRNNYYHHCASPFLILKSFRRLWLKAGVDRMHCIFLPYLEVGLLIYFRLPVPTCPSNTDGVSNIITKVKSQSSLLSANLNCTGIKVQNAATKYSNYNSEFWINNLSLDQPSRNLRNTTFERPVYPAHQFPLHHSPAPRSAHVLCFIISQHLQCCIVATQNQRLK